MEHKLNGEIVIVTGGAGMLGRQYMKAIKEIGGLPVSLDLNISPEGISLTCDITNEDSLLNAYNQIRKTLIPPIYGLINNAAIDPKFDQSAGETPKSRLEVFPLEQWNKELAVGLTGAFLCTKIFGAEMVRYGRGSIINISSVLGHVAPNQALYKKDQQLVDYGKHGLHLEPQDEKQPVKPVTYSAIKHAIIGLTRYTATYWADKGVRCNAISPGGVFNGHSDDFVQRLSKYIPLGRMARKDEYNAAVQFLLTDASSFMTGSVLQIDGGQTTW